MTLFRDISVVWATFNIIASFLIFFEYRYSLKKTALLMICFMLPVTIFQVWFLLKVGPAVMAQCIFFTMALPCALFFFPLSQYRDGRFFYTFFLVCDINASITILTFLLDYYLPFDNYIVMLISRIIAFPLVEYCSYKWLRTPYLTVQRDVKKGWSAFAITSALFYILLIGLFSYPNMISERPVYIPLLILTVILIPCINICAFLALFRQQELYKLRNKEQLLMIQTESLKSRIEQTRHSEERIAIAKHDLRHQFQVLDELLKQSDTLSARRYINAELVELSNEISQRYCQNPILNATFITYYNIAESCDIKIESELDIPDTIAFDETELSVVFANAIENAINALRSLPLDKRIIKCKCIRYPQFMFRISNPYMGKISFDNDGYPISDKKDHGLGSRSIKAYCEKHNAMCAYTTDDNYFTLQITMPDEKPN